MQIQSVKNANSGIKFTADGRLEQASAFVNMSDSQIRELAYVASYDPKHEKKSHKSLSRKLFAIPIVDSIAKGILTNGANSTKLNAAGKRAGWWALGLGAIGIYNAISNKIVSKSEKAQNFERNNPLASTLFNFGLIWVGLDLGAFGLSKLQPKLSKFKENLYLKYPEHAAKLNTKIGVVKTFLNESKAAKFVSENVNKAASYVSGKAPWAAKAGNHVLRNAVWYTLGLGLLKMAHQAGKERNKIEKNYREIKNAQLETAQYLTNALGVERDVLSQNQRALARELRHQMDKTDPNVEV